ncbi:AbgT transporter [Methylobacterium sp. ME121]|nr:AbgT transporter [Methylobacterium sp. ME121]
MREPAPTQTPRLAVATPGIGSVTTVTPFGSRVVRRDGEAACVEKCWFIDGSSRRGPDAARIPSPVRERGRGA